MKYFLTILSLVFLVFTVSCNTEKMNYVKKMVSLNGYERLEKDSVKRNMELNILSVYPAEHSCNDSEKYANLYIAKQPNGKVIYVFELCEEVSDFAYDTTDRRVPLIIPEEILNEKQTNVIIFVPKDFNLPKGAKYLFAKLGALDES